MKEWKITAELNLDASNYKDVIVEANTRRKAVIFAEKKFKHEGAFHVNIIKVEELMIHK